MKYIIAITLTSSIITSRGTNESSRSGLNIVATTQHGRWHAPGRYDHRQPKSKNILLFVVLYMGVCFVIEHS